MTVPSHKQIVVIGGGIIGCSTAYHLARDHKADIVLLERDRLSSGTSWHAAGLVGQLRSSASITQVLKYSVELYRNLADETGLATGWKQNGGLRLACNEDRWTEIKRQATTAHSFGLDMMLLSPGDAQKLWPLMDISDLVGAAFLPTDGQASPSDITQSLAKGARLHGATIIENIRVTDIKVKAGRVAGVMTDQGEIGCEAIVNCAGLWAKEIGRMAGVRVPLQALQHQYLITEKIDGVTSDLPTLRDPDRFIYFKEDVGGLVMGGYERDPMAWPAAAADAGAQDDLPADFAFQLLESNWDHFEQHMTQALVRVPALQNVGVRQLLNGPESFTPDGSYILGEAPEVAGFFVGAGFNAFGIAAAGGAGWTLADWVVNGEQPLDLWSVDIRRFSSVYDSDAWVRERTLEAYGKHYTIVFPHEEYESARGVITSPLYQRLKENGACFGAKLGWERANWFAAPGEEATDRYAMGRQNWFDAVGREHQAVRERVGLFDQSSFAKFELQGTDAAQALSWIAANDVDRAVGQITYTQMLSHAGGIACDLTVARLAEDHYYIVTGTGFRSHDFAWISEHIPKGYDARLSDVTEAWATLSLFGPEARNVLAAVTEDDVSHTGFPFGRLKVITIAGHQVRALRITYVGELGWELHMPKAAALAVFDALYQAGQGHGQGHNVQLAGYRAIESLRLEKGYRAWGSDITPNDNPFEAGLGWAVKLNRDIDFIGRAACEEIFAKPLAKRLAGFTANDPDVVLLGRESIIRNGAYAGYLTSGGFGYTIGKPIGYGYVRNLKGGSDQEILNADYQLEVAGARIPCTPHLKPLYDPGMKKVKA